GHTYEKRAEMKNTTSTTLGWLLGRFQKTPALGHKARRLTKSQLLGIETLEDRTVLAAPQSILVGTLGMLGVVPSAPPPPPSGTPSAQLQADTQKLQADSLAVQSKSAVTVAELTGLQLDDQSVNQAGVTFDPKSLTAATDGLVRAVLAGNPAPAKANFNALFAGKVAQSVIDKVFAEEVQIVKDSKITVTQLNTIKTDNAAIQKDLGNPPPPAPPAAPTAPTGTPTQLDKDTQKLHNDVLAVQKTSGVTVAELTALGGDDQTVVRAKITLDGKALIQATDKLVRAVLAGNPATAKSDFGALFGGKLAQTDIDKAFNDMVNIVKDSKITLAQLNTIAADNAAIQKDLAATPPTGTTPTPPPPSLAGALSILGVIPAP
ncbi:MAG: hypothetical protein JWM11_1741, partial [Planctomycetaceae bacterium]|nr:hypothetical protein [Planctomycetaceae bacterium]